MTTTCTCCRSQVGSEALANKNNDLYDAQGVGPNMFRIQGQPPNRLSALPCLMAEAFHVPACSVVFPSFEPWEGSSLLHTVAEL